MQNVINVKVGYYIPIDAFACDIVANVSTLNFGWEQRTVSLSPDKKQTKLIKTLISAYQPN